MTHWLSSGFQRSSDIRPLLHRRCGSGLNLGDQGAIRRLEGIRLIAKSIGVELATIVLYDDPLVHSILVLRPSNTASAHSAHSITRFLCGVKQTILALALNRDVK